MAHNMWQDKGRMNLEQKRLTRPFTVKEVEYAIQEMKTDNIPRPHGFTIIFYKKFRGILKWWIL
jgi:hypothetical protein